MRSQNTLQKIESTHAYWNFLLKRSGGSQAFLGLSTVAEVVLFAPAFAVVALPHLLEGRLPALAPLAAVGALLVLGNYVTLALAYRHGDLSFVYPVTGPKRIGVGLVIAGSMLIAFAR